VGRSERLARSLGVSKGSSSLMETSDSFRDVRDSEVRLRDECESSDSFCEASLTESERFLPLARDLMSCVVLC
jgi:hypothetical protein